MPVSLDNDNIGLIDILNTINDSLSPLSDDTTKGILRSIGDAGDSPTNTTGKTVLQLLTETLAQLDITLSALRDALLGTDSKALTDLYNKAYDNTGDVIKVDKASSEKTLSGEIDTSTDTSPQTVVTPASGKKISTRGVFLFSNSTSGEIEARFPSSGKLIGKIYCTKYYNVSLPEVKFEGNVDESIQISWSGVSSGAKIFWVIKYKEV